MSRAVLDIDKAPTCQYGGEDSKPNGNGNVFQKSGKDKDNNSTEDNLKMVTTTVTNEKIAAIPVIRIHEEPCDTIVCSEGNGEQVPPKDGDKVNQSKIVTDGLTPDLRLSEAICDATPLSEEKEGISEELLEALEIVVQKSTERLDTDSEECYKMGSRPKGYALVISNETFNSEKYPRRVGAEKDCENLTKLFTELGYEVIVRKDLSKLDFQNEVVKFTSLEHNKVDSTILFILTHGEPGTSSGVNLITSDSLTINSEWVVEQFYGKYCEELIGKPKLFFFQCCRGSETERYVSMRRRSSVQCDGGPTLVPNKSDILIVYPCTPGNVALRCEENGSWLVYFLCKVFMENAHKKDVATMLNLISRQMKQTFDEDRGTEVLCPTFRGFDRKMFFNPGLYDN